MRKHSAGRPHHSLPAPLPAHHDLFSAPVPSPSSSCSSPSSSPSSPSSFAQQGSTCTTTESAMVGRPDSATFKRVTNLADELRYKEELKLRELALRHQQSPLRLVTSASSPLANDPNIVVMTDTYVEYRSRKYTERLLQKKREEQRQMEEWEKSYNDLRGAGYTADENVGDEDEEELEDEHDSEGGGPSNLTIRDLLRERSKKKREMEKERERRMAEGTHKESEDREEELTIKELLQKRRMQKKAKDRISEVRDAFASSKIPSMDEYGEEWEYDEGRSAEGRTNSTSADELQPAAKQGGGFAQMVKGKILKKKRSSKDGSFGSGDLVISGPDQASFKRLTNPIETRNAILQRLLEERKSRTEGITYNARIVLDVAVVEAWDLPSSDRSVIPYCTLQLEGTTQVAETTREPMNGGMWNQDFTFMYYESADNAGKLVIKVYNSSRSKSRAMPIGAVSIDPSQFQEGQLWELWLDLRDPHVPSTWYWDRKLEEVPLLPTGSGSALPHGFIHLKVHKNTKKDMGFLSFYGQPLNAIPLRVEVGDIVLFSDEKELAKQCIHIATSSKWDHMGLVVRMRGANSLLLLESTMDGVDVFNLNERLDFYRETCTLGIRRLQLQRTPEMANAMLEFVDEVVGKPYNMNFVQLVKGKWGKNQEDNVSAYFCSQLVAAAYQKMNLLSSSIPSTNYLPSHFEGDQKRMRLLNGARLSEVYIIPSK